MSTIASSSQESVVCVFSFQSPCRRTNENKDRIVINVHVSTAEISSDPTQPIWKTPSRHNWSCQTTFDYPRGIFLSTPEAQQRDAAFTMIQDLEIPFPLENIHWAHGFPKDRQGESKLDNMDSIVDRLLDLAHDCALKEENGGFLDIRITKWQKLPLEEFQKTVKPRPQAKGALDDWIEENKNDVNVDRSCRFIYNLHHKSPKENPYFGLKSVMVKKEIEGGDGEEACCCVICKRDMKKGSQVIQMPCSHVFHGFCIFPWLAVNPTCPLCRFTLFKKQTK